MQEGLKAILTFKWIGLCFYDWKNLQRPNMVSLKQNQQPKANAQWWKPLCQTLLFFTVKLGFAWLTLKQSNQWSRNCSRLIVRLKGQQYAIKNNQDIHMQLWAQFKQ